MQQTWFNRLWVYFMHKAGLQELNTFYKKSNCEDQLFREEVKLV